MNVPTIEMPTAEALAKAEAFAADTHADSAEFYQACESAYRQLAKGRRLIHLSRALRGAGLHEDGSPKLAIARADRKEVMFRWRQHWGDQPRNTIRFDCSKRHDFTWLTLMRDVDMRQSAPGRTDGYAIVPTVPADVRPHTGQLKDWWVLFEVEEWAPRSLIAEAPYDPLLLQHVGGELYSVLGEWDLTEIERAILEGALSTN